MSNAGKTVIEGVFDAVEVSASIPIHGRATVEINGGIGTVNIERSSDEGTTWIIAAKNADGDQAIYVTTAGTGFNGIIDEPEYGILYRLNCTANTSDIDYRVAVNQAD